MKRPFSFSPPKTARLQKKRNYHPRLEQLDIRLSPALVVPPFSSLPGADQTIYLDFDGHTITGSYWNDATHPSIVSPAYDTDGDPANYSASELADIQNIWQRMSEDFIPFNVNVTTVDPGVPGLIYSGGADTKYGVRVLFTVDNFLNCGCGGMAYVGTFRTGSDTPALVFTTGGKGGAEAGSHETGHTLGLGHDGDSSQGYYPGHGSGATSWSPIMGVGYYTNLSQWSKGQYYDANQTQDDLAIITTQNGFGYRADDHGSTNATADPLTVSAFVNVSGSGIIETNTDIDVFWFVTGAGPVNLNITPFTPGPNLDVKADLYDTANNLVVSSNDITTISANIALTLPAGRYYLQIDGTGFGDPMNSTPVGYTDYGSLGRYTISGTITSATPPGVTLNKTAVAVAEGGNTDSYTAKLDYPPTSNVTITLNPGSQVTVTPSTLIFTPLNWNTPQTVTVTAINDTVSEGNHSGTITHVISTSDTGYKTVTVSNVTANITDGVTVIQSGGTTNVAEGGSTDTYTVAIHQAPTSPVTILINAGSQVTVSPATLIFDASNWNTPQVVTVTAVNDTIAQGPRSITITHSVSTTDPFFRTLTVLSVQTNITDNDAVGVTLSQSDGSTYVIQGGSPDSYTVVLQSQPQNDVTITLNPGPQISVSPAILIFNSSNWDTPHTVLVSAVTTGSGTQIDTIGHTASSSDLTYNGLAIANLSVTVAERSGLIINGTSGNDSIRITPAADLSMFQVSVNGIITRVPLPFTYSQLVILAGNGTDTIQINNPLVPIFIDGGSGTDSLTINGQNGAANSFTLSGPTLTANGQLLINYGLENLTVNGMMGNDTFAVQYSPDPSLKNIIFNGGLGSDTFIGQDVSNTWNMTGSNTGQLNGFVKFTSTENLTGGTTKDIFIFGPGKNLTGRLNGAGGNDVLDYSLYITPLVFNLQTGWATGVAGGIQNIETILAGKSTSDKLTGPDGTSTWSITGKNAGAVNGLSFQNIENLNGGSGNDAFTFADAATITGKIDGGSGTGDALDYSAYSTGINVNLQAKKITAITGGYANIEGFTGGSAINTLTAPNKTNAWALTGTDAGTVFDGLTTYTFSGMANLFGGAAADSFTGTGSWTGKLDGGFGLDTLTGNDSTNHTWNITAQNSGTVDGHAFVNVENLKGGALNDTFALKLGSSITGKIDGGAGSDILDYSVITTAISVNLGTGLATSTAGIKGLEQFLAGSSSNNSLIAFNLANTWNLTASNAGNLTNSSGTYSFTNFQNLTGGTMADSFTLAVADGWTGFLQGGQGYDTLTAFGTGNTWTVTTLNGHKFGSIEDTQ